MTESEHIKKVGISSGRVINTQDGVLIGEMSFKMTSDELDMENWFKLETSKTSAPRTGIMINVDGENVCYYEAQSTFKFTDNTASKDASLENLIVSSGIQNSDPNISTYKEYELNPSFDKNIYEYELKLYYYIDKIDIKALLSDEKSNMKIKLPKRDDNNNLIYEADGTKILYEEKEIADNVPVEVTLNKLGEPDTQITITVKAEDKKTEKEYKLVIKRPYGTIKGKISMEPITFTTDKHIAEVLAYSDKDTQGLVDWSTMISNSNSNISDNLNNILRGDESTSQESIAEKVKVITNDDGTFEIHLIPEIYHILIDRKGYLDQYYINIELTENMTIDLAETETNGIIELIAGDIDKDGLIGIKDKMIMTKENGKSKILDSNFNEKCDFNDDGLIDIKDKTLSTKDNGLIRKIIDLKGGNT